MNEYGTTAHPRQQEFEYPVEGPRTETAKQIIENMGCILTEIDNSVSMIESGIIAPGGGMALESREPREESMLDTMRRQRDHAESILKALCRIREALW